MPEGPECHAIGARLRAWLVGERIEGFEVVAGRYARSPFPGAEMLRTAVECGRASVSGVGVKGKMIVIVLDDGDIALVSTLGLSGTWSTRRTANCDIRFDTSRHQVWFKDQLHYGTLTVVNRHGLARRLRRLGPDVTTGAGIGRAWWREFAVRRGDKTVAEVLMNQAWMSGIGNYLKAEILFAAAIAPMSRLDDLPRSKLEDLRRCINQIPRAWHASRTGRGPRRVMRVYGKRRGPNGEAITRTKTSDARVTHWAPDVQVEYTAH